MTAPTRERVLTRLETVNRQDATRPRRPREIVEQLDIEVDDLPLRYLPPLTVLEAQREMRAPTFDSSQIPVILRKFKVPSEVMDTITGPTLSRVLVKPHLVQRI